MKYLKDQNDIITIFPKYLLTYSDFYRAIAYLLRDKLYELNIKFNNRNELKLVSLFQDVFDIINPHVDNIFSSFDVYANDTGFNIIFFNDQDDKKESFIKEEVRVEYRE